MSSILRTAQAELRKHTLDTFNDKLHGVVTPGCPHCTKAFYTISQLMDHLADDILPGILERAFSTATKFVYCQSCKATVEDETTRQPIQEQGPVLLGPLVDAILA